MYLFALCFKHILLDKHIAMLGFYYFPMLQAKAVAEKNERDMQQQREQAERHASTFVINS